MAITGMTKRRSARRAPTRYGRLRTGGLSGPDARERWGTRAFAAGILFAACVPSSAQTWRIQSAISTEFDLTDNADLTPNGRSDFISQIAPRLTVREIGAHTRLDARVALPVVISARGSSSTQSSSVRPEVNVTGTAELVPHLFFVDGSVQVSQQYASPFGARPQNVVNDTNNRYTAQLYSVSPYLRADGPGDLHYDLRSNNTWTGASDTSSNLDRSYTSEITGNITSAARPFGWGLEYDRVDSSFRDQETQRTEIGRVRGNWRIDPQVELSATVGYENDSFVLLETSGTTYGAGVKWHPSDRTTLSADWEHRFFGGSYRVAYDHRSPLTVWTLRASRDITSYPQELARLAGGANVSTLLDQIFASRVTDPVQRQSLVDQLIRERGLPDVLGAPTTLTTQRVTLQQSVQGTVGLLGARNTVFVTLFHTKSEPVGGTAALADVLGQFQDNNTQTGASVVWTYKLLEFYTLSTSADWSRAVPNGDIEGTSTQRSIRVQLTAPLSPKTDAFAGVRHQRLVSDIQAGYRENAIFFGMAHRFY